MKNPQKNSRKDNVAKKKVTDKSAFLDFMEKFVTENYINVVNASVASNPVITAEKPKQKPVAEPVANNPFGEPAEEDEDDGNLPWD